MNQVGSKLFRLHVWFYDRVFEVGRSGGTISSYIKFQMVATGYEIGARFISEGRVALIYEQYMYM